MSTEPWHLDRIDQRSSVLDNMLYHPVGDGEGINIYILDTGMHTKPVNFYTIMNFWPKHMSWDL